MTDQPNSPAPGAMPPHGSAPTPDPSAVTQPVAWTPAVSTPETAGVAQPAPTQPPAPQQPAPMPSMPPVVQPPAPQQPAPPPQEWYAAPPQYAPTPAPAAPRKRSVGPAALMTAVLATAVLTSTGTYIAVTAADNRAPATSNAALPGAAATPPAGAAAPATPPPATPAPATGERSIVDIVKAVSPAVVTITAEGVSTGGSAFGQGATATATGSGVIFDASGLVLTNRHVVSGNPAKLTVTLKDGRTLDASIYGIDTLTDLAIVKVSGSDLPTAPIGDSSAIQVGQEAIAIGSPLGEFTDSVTSGIVSAIGRSIQVEDGTTITNLIQTDTAINPGNSGGPLLDRSGNVIGINTAVAGGAQGIGFAIPVNIARPLLAQASAGKELARAWLGIRFQTIDPELKSQANLPVDNGAWIPKSTAVAANGGNGAQPAPSQDPNQGQDPTFGLTPDQLDQLFKQFGIDPNQLPQGQNPLGQGQGGQPAAQGPSIVAGSPAEAAGLREGDIITAVNGTALTATSPLDLVVSQLTPGDTASLTVLRDGQTVTLSITLGTRPATL